MKIKPEGLSSEAVTARRTMLYLVSDAGKKLMPLAQLRDSSARCAPFKVQGSNVQGARSAHPELRIIGE